jgi:hypothetical protein
MKFMHTLLFQITVLLVSLVVFAHPLRANTRDAIQAETPHAKTVPLTKSNPSYQLVSTILAGVESGFVFVIAPLMATLLFGLAMWRVVPSRRSEPEEVIEEAPVELPPLREIPHPITRF